MALKYIICDGKAYKCDGAGARHLVRGSLRAWLVYLDVASPLLLLLTLISS